MGKWGFPVGHGAYICMYRGREGDGGKERGLGGKGGEGGESRGVGDSREAYLL